MNALTMADDRLRAIKLKAITLQTRTSKHIRSDRVLKGKLVFLITNRKSNHGYGS
jgi:hypothetical protein